MLLLSLLEEICVYLRWVLSESWIEQKKNALHFFMLFVHRNTVVIGYLPRLPEQPAAAYFVNVLKMFVEGELWFLFHCI